jgi:ribosomal protein S18 acetylase RimI-like enzyme
MVPRTSVSATLRILTAQDSAAVRAFATSVLGDAPYSDVMLATLESALARTTDEYRAIVASAESGLVGAIVFGEVAGARGAGRIHLIAVDAKVRRRGIAMDLVNAACANLAERGGRFVAVELPADARLVGARRLGDRTGFREEGRIDDYVRDGVALILLRRELRTSPHDAAL